MVFFKKLSLILFLVISSINLAALEDSSTVFSGIAATQQQTASAFSNPEAYKELHCDALLKSLNRTETPFGAWALQNMLTHPLVEADTLMHRQQALAVLIYDPQAFNQYQKIIQKLNQKELINYWQASTLHNDTQALYYNFFGFFPHISNYLNSSKIALSLLGNVNSALTIIGYFGKQFFGSGLKESMFAQHHKTTPNYMQAIKESFYYPFLIHNPFESYFTHTKQSDFSFFYESHKLSAGDWKSYFQSCITDENLAASAPAIALLGTAATVALYDYLTYQDISNHVTKIKNTYKTTADLCTEIYHIALWYKGCLELYDFSQKYTVFAELTNYAVIKKYIHEKDVSPELKKLFEVLESSESFSTGTALLTHKLLLQVKDELVPLMKAAGHYDALLSISKLYLEQQNSNAQYCLPAFNQHSVGLEYTNFWHPGVTNGTPVTNTIALGNGNPRNIIITGPNGGGKSTVMAAISWGILLAQGWGIVPAQHASMPIFTGLRTFLSPQADLEQGLSTFMAEKRRLDALISCIDSLKDTDVYFFIVDEPCRGTIERVAEQYVIQLCKKLTESNTCISVLATHLEKPTLCAEQSPHYMNYQMELQDTQYGFVRTFKLLPGAADWWFNDEPRRTRFLLEL